MNSVNALLIDGEYFSRRLIKLLLKEVHLNVVCAGSLGEGCLLFKEGKKNFCLIILSLQMAKLLENSAYDCFCKDVPVIALNDEFCDNEIAEKLKSLGYAECLRKPFDFDSKEIFIKKINEYIKN